MKAQTALVLEPELLPPYVHYVCGWEIWANACLLCVSRSGASETEYLKKKAGSCWKKKGEGALICSDMCCKAKQKKERAG